MRLDDFFKLLSTLPVDDYIVRIKLKYDDEKEYRYTNEILTYDGSDYEGSIYHWNNDWNEGEQDIEVVGYIPVTDIDTFYIPIDKNVINVCGKCIHLIFRDYKHMTGICSITGLNHTFEDTCDHEEEMQ